MRIVATIAFLFISLPCFAKQVAKVKKPAPNVVAKAAPAAVTRAPAGVMNDPNKAVEVRGQSRTLSMMLVLKNGKENIDFIQPRKNYEREISNTNF